MSIQVNDFKWEKGKNDLKYIELLEKTLDTQKRLTNEAIAKIKTLAAENAELKKELYNKKNKAAVNKDRLTERNETDTAHYFPLCFEKCDGLGVSCKCDKCELIYDVCDKLGNYEDLDEQGLLMKLPCKVGNTLYKIYKRPTKCTIHGEYKDDYTCQGCEELECDSSYCWDIYMYKSDVKNIVCDLDNFGKTIFFTQSEAEKKLKELEEK